MLEAPLSFNVRPRGKPIPHLPEETYARPTDKGHDLYMRVAAKSRMSVHRLRITKASDGSPVPDSEDVTIDSIGLFENSSIFVKDLGLQISWRTVFIIEYLGPLLIHPLIYFLRSTVYRSPEKPFPPPSLSQTLSLALITVHFAKREVETMFVHRFSNATMPAFNIFKNSAHYWLLGGINIALFTYSPAEACPTAHPPPSLFGLPSSIFPALAITLFIVGELGNLSAHMTLRNLRKDPTSKERGIPRTGVFALLPNVTCPNYTFEAIAWIAIYLANRSLSTVVFAAVAIGQMAIWARKKEKRYRQEFAGKGYKPKRWAMVPGIV
ncbi:MAG: 3-oxo-5a-steroid 4- dehydrogenase [Alyxoria varia]|nr:MAG: 3-oxo-5a-steroid 4- dehydrogenase [Alyxoria varia]